MVSKKAVPKKVVKKGTGPGPGGKKPATEGPGTKKKVAPKPSTASKGAPQGRSLSITMYNVGFGDAFLVEIPAKARTHRILFDCGSIKANGEAIDDVVNRIINDCTDQHGSHIDLLVATHRHRDHVSGFASERWNAVTVGEVWMPWTEDPRDPKARKIRETQSKLALALDSSLAVSAAASPAAAASLAPIRTMVGNALTNEAAMGTLHTGFLGAPTRRFLPAKDAGVDPIVLNQLPEVQFFVLGPSRDESVIRDMDPPKGEGYLAMRAGLDQTGGCPEPLAPEWRYTPFASGVDEQWLSAGDRKMISSFSQDDALALAVSLDKAVNGTSLLIVMKVGQSHLLFPGDAQWGTWRAAMAVPEWRTLLKKTAFYKIGHHGSHNATPVSLVTDLLPDGFAAMASTMAMPSWPNIPKPQLLDALKHKSPRVARSDERSKVQGFDYGSDGRTVSVRIPF